MRRKKNEKEKRKKIYARIHAGAIILRASPATRSTTTSGNGSVSATQAEKY